MNQGHLKVKKGKKGSCNCCHRCCEYGNIICEIILSIMTILIWSGIVFSITSSNKDDRIPYIVLTSIIYAIYLIFELCSNILESLSNEKSPKEFKLLMGKIFIVFPTIKFITTISERTYYKDTDDKEDYRDTYVGTESSNLGIYSSRDISGPLNFYPNNHSYAFVSIKTEINFADTISYSDYIDERAKMKYYDAKMPNYVYEFSEERTIDGITRKAYLVNLYGNKNFFFSKAVYIIFSILTLGQIYKLIFRCMTKYMVYTVRKIISTRYNLSQDEKYDPFEPKIIFPKEVCSYDKRETSYFNKEMNVVPPTQEELTKSLKYKDYIPQFDIYKGNNKHLTGTVVEVKNNNYNESNKETIFNTLTINSQINPETNNNIFNESNKSFQIDGNIYNK